MVHPSKFARLRHAGVVLGNAVKTRPGLWLGIAMVALVGVVWAVAKLMITAGGGAMLALVRDASHQVGGGGLWGAAGAAAEGSQQHMGPHGRGIAPGFKYVFTSSGDFPRMHAGPSYDSPVVASPANGSRLLYTDVTTKGGEDWYQVQMPSGTTGWVPGSATTDTRPDGPPPPSHIQFIHRDVIIGGSSDTAGARG